MRQRTLMWIGMLLLVMGSFVVLMMRTDHLPELPFQMGPGMRIRAVDMEKPPAPGSHQFQRGDRVVGIHNQSVEDMRDFRAVVQNLPFVDPNAPGEAGKEDGKGAGGGAPRLPQVSEDGSGKQRARPPNRRPYVELDYQIVRPLHRFTISLQGQQLDPTQLPPGVEPTDRLVELDGRAMQNIGPEFLRSIITSRPEASLGFERRNAVFAGRIRLHQAGLPYGLMIVFGLAFFLLVAMWRMPSHTLKPTTPAAIAAETICFAWISVIAFQYQWVLSDYVLTSGAVIGLVMIRPFAIFARERLAVDSVMFGWITLGVGTVFSTLIVASLFGGYFPNPESALHLAALLAGLALVYEVVITGLSESTSFTFGERGTYLAGILILAFVVFAIAWYTEPVQVAESHWRWFAMFMLALVWLSDVLLCFRGTGVMQHGQISDSARRQRALLGYFETLADAIGPADLELILYHDKKGAVTLRPIVPEEQEPGEEGEEEPLDELVLEVAMTDDRLRDAVAILVQENALYPMPQGDDGASPISGIARTMGIVLALPLTPPPHSIVIEQITLIVVARRDPETDEGPLLDAVEVLDMAQGELSAQVWSAALVEGFDKIFAETVNRLTALGDERRVAHFEKAEEDEDQENEELLESREQLRTTREQLDTQRQQTAEAVDRHRSTARECKSLREAMAMQMNVPPDFAHFLEEELLGALQYLLQTDEPIVLAGSSGVGKTFVAQCLHLLSERTEGQVVFAQPWLFDPAHHRALFFGTELPEDQELPEDAEIAVGLLEAARGGTLIVRRAEVMADAMLLRLMEACEEHDILLLMTFNDDFAEQHSVFEGRDVSLSELLEHREVLIPELLRRPEILSNALHLFLEEACLESGRPMIQFSPGALDALLRYPYPGQFPEARVVVRCALRSSRGDMIEVGDLYTDVRREGFAH